MLFCTEGSSKDSAKRDASVAARNEGWEGASVDALFSQLVVALTHATHSTDVLRVFAQQHLESSFFIDALHNVSHLLTFRH